MTTQVTYNGNVKLINRVFIMNNKNRKAVGNGKVKIHFQIQEDVYNLIRIVAEKKGLALSNLVNEGMKKYLIEELRTLEAHEQAIELYLNKSSTQ